MTGIIQQVNIDALMAQWSASWDLWFDQTTDASSGEIATYLATKKSEYETWFNNLTSVLEGDVAANLASRVVHIEGVLDGLVTERSIYHDLMDADGLEIRDSVGNGILGKIVFQSL